jgi:uncharacterized protein (UPF0335 family)
VGRRRQTLLPDALFKWGTTGMVNGEVGGNAANKQLIQHVEKIERLIEDRQAINDDIKDVKALAKVDGYDARTIMEVIKLRKMEPHVRQERKALLDTYLAAFGIDD